MEQDVRSNDIITMLANFMETQPHLMHSSQSNNNNSNTVPHGSNAMSNNSANIQTVTSQAAVVTSQTPSAALNPQMMGLGSQAATGTAPNNSTSDAELAEIERISSTFIHPNFPSVSCAVSSTMPGDNLMYGGTNSIEMVEGVGSVLDNRIQPYHDFAHNPAAILEALTSMDKDSFGDGSIMTSSPNQQCPTCVRPDTANHQTASFAQSFISLLQNQPQIDTCSNLWTMNQVQHSSGNVNYGGSTKQRTDQAVLGTRPLLTAADGQTIPNLNNQSSSAITSNRLDSVTTHDIAQPHLMYTTPTTKSTKVMQHTGRMIPAKKVNQHYAQNDRLQYDERKFGGKKRNDLLLSMNEAGITNDSGIAVEDRSKEKRLTTTPIPSDADKSSSSCSSSGSISGPEQSPDHISDRLSSGRLNGPQQVVFMGGKSQTLGQGGIVTSQNPNSLKTYPCYGNVVNFDTINFSPVMDNNSGASGELGGEVRKSSGGHELSGAVPISDSIVEIDETVSSPLENIPVSPSTPTAEHAESNPSLKSSFGLQRSDTVNGNGMSYTNLQTITPSSLEHQRTVNTALSARTANLTKSEQLRRQSSGHKHHKSKDLNNNVETVKEGRKFDEVGEASRSSKEKQRKSRMPKHPRPKNIMQEADKYYPGYQTINTHDNTFVTQNSANGYVSNAKPKVNADPLKKKNSKSQESEKRHGPLYSSLQQQQHKMHPSNNFNQSLVVALPTQFPPSNNRVESRPVPNHGSAVQHMGVDPSESATKVRQWQTVTAVQGPKLPPMLSEQDRIPKRGRPSKKMMQENLKIKNNAPGTANRSNVPPQPSAVAAPKSTQQKVAQVNPSNPKLVSMYTINDKGFMEEIAPKLKENRRSKERTQAFLKMLAEIKTASKQQMAADPKFGEKAKTGLEKAVKKRSKPRTKVFGRNVTQLTETGITETMYTFSALAQQYKISNSIVSRATENLLKSAAVKRNKERSLANSASAGQQRPTVSSNRKGVSEPHCDISNPTSSKATTTKQQLPADISLKKSPIVSTVNKILPVTSLPLAQVETDTLMSGKTERRVVVQNVPNVLPSLDVFEENTIEKAPSATTPHSMNELETTTEDAVTPNAKSKHKKKKHKKHKKHKCVDSKGGSIKKKKKDKDRKKKSKKKLKVKCTQGVTPSSSVSVVKPPTNIKQGLATATKQPSDIGKHVSSTSPKLTPTSISVTKKKDSFSPVFRQRNAGEAIAPNLYLEDHAYDGEDSSSDETNASPKSYTGKIVTSAMKEDLSSFAQYSNSTMGFGMFSSSKLGHQNEVSAASESQSKPVKTGEAQNQENLFSSQSGLRSKKHHKHKRKKFFRKSKNNCDPALLVLLDEILVSVKNLNLGPTNGGTSATRAQSSANIFFATITSDTPQVSLWTSPHTNSFGSQRNDYQARILRDAAFKKHLTGPNKKAYPKTSDFITSSSNGAIFSAESSKQVYSASSTALSVFCSSPFFQKYGYVSRLQMSTSSMTTMSTLQHTSALQHSVATEPRAAPCVSTNALPSAPNITEKIQESLTAGGPIDVDSQLSESKPEKRKRGWPRGKPRGPRAKKGRIAMGESHVNMLPKHPKQTAAGDASPQVKLPEMKNPSNDALYSNDTKVEVLDASHIEPIAPVTKEQSKASQAVEKQEMTSNHKNQGTDEETNAGELPSDAAAPEKDLSQIVSESLLHQIKQAIAASLPAHPSVNKDAITKSVDAAVQSYMEKMIGAKMQGQDGKSPSSSAQASGTTTPYRKSGKRVTRSRSSTEGAIGNISPSNGEVPHRLNADKHPKKVWACKHNDAKIHEPITSVSQGVTTPTNHSNMSHPTLVKKRGPGRPRKYPLLTTQAQGSNSPLSLDPRQGKVPTASATVVPFKRKGVVGHAAVNCLKTPAVQNKGVNVKENNSKIDVTESVTISRERAVVSLNALCSAKSLQVKMRSTSFENTPEPGLYSGTPVEEHILDAIDETVDKYSWDNYKKFEEACLAVEKQMSGENENSSADGKRRSSGPKKSIESVIEKLKNKQAQSMHTAATALLQLHDIQVNSHMEKRAEQNITKKKLALSHHGGVPAKRPRGRPRKHPLPEEDPELSTKRPKVTTVETKQSTIRKERPSSDSSKDSSSSDPVRVRSALATAMCSLVNPATSPLKPVLQAGLYSSTFKQDKSSPQENMEDSDCEGLQLLPPFDAGLYLRRTRRDFQLPHDIWWQYRNEKLSITQDLSTNFMKINKNVYSTPRPSPNLGDHICTCKPQAGEPSCGKQCLNRLMCIECSPSSCPCGSSCSNQAMQKSQNSEKLKRIKTKDRGWGLGTDECIQGGSFIMEYVGEVISDAEFRLRMVELYHAYGRHYCLQLDASTVIVAYWMGNDSRFVNHSCDPNCEIQKWCINGEHRLGLFALREIKLGEELTFDYSCHAYNVLHHQECRCASKNCRGVIGGRVTRSPSHDSEAPCSSSVKSGTKQVTTSKAKSNVREGGKSAKDELVGVKEFSILQMKPICARDQEFIRIRQLFLIRNLAQVRRKEEQQHKEVPKRSGNMSEKLKTGHKSKAKKKQSKEEREKIEKAVTEMYTAIATCKDQNGVSVAIPFMNLPSRKKNPEYYERISDPIDLSVIERNIMTNHYKDIETFNSDVQRVFRNAEKYHGRKSTLGKDVIRLRKAYVNARGTTLLVLNGHKKPGKVDQVSDDNLDEGNENIHRKNEDYIRCICCIYKDEGLMVQCEKCYVWQHCDCMGVKPGSTDRYLCEECDPRQMSKEVKVIPAPPNTPPGHTYYVTLLRDNLLVKQGDCAYLMRDHRLRHNSNPPSMRNSHRNLANISQENLDIFRIEKLWTDERGDKYAYGYHFLRPHETHHSPSRTFYSNELFASPFNEIIPLEAVVGLCMVMDLYTYCKGKPKDYKMSDIFICDFRVDKAAGLFTRITKKRYPVCTKPHVFDSYKQKITPKKNFQPHQVPEQYKKPSAGRPAGVVEALDTAEPNGHVDELDDNTCHLDEERMECGEGMELTEGNPQIGTGRWKKRQRLNGIAHKLLSKLPKQAVDVSYLLEPGSGKRQRKKTQLSLESLSQQK